MAPLVVRASEVIQGMAVKAQGLLENPDADVAVALAGEDDALDKIRDEMVAMATLRHWPYEARHAEDTVLLARFYERYGDHCVSVASRIVYLDQREGDSIPEQGYWPEVS